jgi:hypothetical protein
MQACDGFVSCPACERKVFQGLLFPGRGCSSGCARQTLERQASSEARQQASAGGSAKSLGPDDDVASGDISEAQAVDPAAAGAAVEVSSKRKRRMRSVPASKPSEPSDASSSADDADAARKLESMFEPMAEDETSYEEVEDELASAAGEPDWCEAESLTSALLTQQPDPGAVFGVMSSGTPDHQRTRAPIGKLRRR